MSSYLFIFYNFHRFYLFFLSQNHKNIDFLVLFSIYLYLTFLPTTFNHFSSPLPSLTSPVTKHSTVSNLLPFISSSTSSSTFFHPSSLRSVIFARDRPRMVSQESVRTPFLVIFFLPGTGTGCPSGNLLKV